MKKASLILPLLILLTACTGRDKNIKKTEGDLNPRFDAYKEAFMGRLWKLYPGWASSVGYHAYDSLLVIPDAAQREKENRFAAENLDSLESIDPAYLSDPNKTDLYMIRDFLKAGVWANNELKAYEWDPSQFNVSSSFAEMLGNNYDSLDTRLHNVHLKLKGIPAYYAAAKKNILNPTREHQEMAIAQNLGGISVFEKSLPDALKRSHLGEAEKDEIRLLAQTAIASITGYANWLKALKNEKPRSFRLGKDLYLKKFEFDIQSRYTATEIYEKAIAHKSELHARMFSLTRQLWPAYMHTQLKDTVTPDARLLAIKQMIDRLSQQHTQADSFQTAIERQIPKLIAFIKKKDLIYIDPSKPLVVRKEPAYMAGLAGASISSPGPYDKNGNTYYNVGSLSGWDKERAESYLREYNTYILQILNIHEAIPGHYTQLVYANQSPSLIKAILGNGAMIEGWAVYTERMMLENGYGGTDGSETSTPEMWLMYYKWNLRSTCNTILDYGVHAGTMSKEEALDLLTKQAFQQAAEAEGKWHRVSVSQVQLCSYFTGYTEIYDLREDLRQKAGSSFHLKQFHEKFLSYGSAPVKYIRELMLSEKEEAVKKSGQ